MNKDYFLFIYFFSFNILTTFNLFRKPHEIPKYGYCLSTYNMLNIVSKQKG